MRVLLGAFACLLLLAGCLGGSPNVTPPQNGMETRTPTATADVVDSPSTTDPTSQTNTSNAACADAPRPSLYGLRQGFGWERDTVRFGAEIPPKTTVHLVALVDGERAGVQTESTGTYGVAIDGGSIALDRPLSGEHTIEVVVSDDTDGDGAFDPATDRRCSDATTGERTVDFDRFGENESA